LFGGDHCQNGTYFLKVNIKIKKTYFYSYLAPMTIHGEGPGGGGGGGVVYIQIGCLQK
jgi:hypothetical protein